MAGKIKSPSKSKSPKYKLFDWNDSLIESVQNRAHGHGKTGALLARIISTKYERGPSMEFLYHLSNLGFYGDDIWYGFTEYCKSDEDMFEAVVELEDKGFYNFILDYKGKQALEALKGKNATKDLS